MTFCDYDIDDYTPRNCGIDFAGIVGLGIIHVDENPSGNELQDVEFWENKTSQTPLRYWAIRNTRGEYQGGDPIYEEDLIGYLATGANHLVTIDVPEVQENRDFWDAIVRQNWKIVLVTAGGLLYYVENPVSFYAKINNPKGIKTAATFQVTMKWTGLSNPYIYPEPEGVFTGLIPDEIAESFGVFDYTYDETFE